ncbi:MAG: ABC transporter permease [Bacteroidia bacterium]|jgi:peptide/nickel transport system permease protein|nr:ABC transporter permease [Bacteroidia bacterium]MDG2041680.1 ABC transporter permease [Bacteroidia bacterium]|tara:strand:+ start:1736 stop:2779 length:1044 start_codon:yes stop_codon:yes gene_type:complete
MWKKITRNKLGLLGLIFIVGLIIISLLGYLVIPDSTPKANDIHLEIALQKPGFSVDFLKIEEIPQHKSSNILQHWLYGSPNRFKKVPISGVIGVDSFSVFSNNGVQLWKRLGRPIISGDISRSTYYLGTDRYGRDMLSRIIIGARVSLMVGFMAVLITMVIGTILGLLAGYFGGWMDQIILWLINVIWSLPSLLIAIAISFAFREKGIYQVFLAIGLSMWVELARVVRGQVLQIKEMEYIQAANVLGFSTFRILIKHILPNIMAPIIVVCAANFASAILLEAGLSFLGLGVQAPTPSWGSMIKEHYNYIVFDAAYLAIIPGVCIMLLVMSFNFLGNALRDALDVKLK